MILQVPDESALIERHEPATQPNWWDAEDSAVAPVLCDEWLASRRSLVLVTPSVVAMLEFNLVVNPAHPDFSRIMVSAPEPVVWDRRLSRPVVAQRDAK